MGRRQQPEIRERLLDGCVGHLLEHGLPVTSLTPVAAAVGVSPRMLIYHFATKDRLVRSALIEARRRQRALFDDALRHRPGTPYVDTLASAWATLSGPAARRYVRLFSVVHALPSAETPWPNFPVMAVHDWLPTITAGPRADCHPRADVLATLVLGVVRGLLLDDRATGEHDRAGEAFAAFLDLLAGRGR
ncbi:TetR/AcrR family transcriptional regulator [Micromonospora sp. NPDC023888]|uniref:TetR/AcrR family transcriptional regulator n=1 Tax=Micromonospora sp. NPDC023888 TaxID=3155607 RepID=UPI0033E3566E